jgi:hypothetical protein
MAAGSNFTGAREREIREMLLYIVRSLVDHPDQADIVLIPQAEGCSFCIHVHPGDLVALTANGGRTVKALRCIVGASGRKLGRRLAVDIVQNTDRPQ